MKINELLSLQKMVRERKNELAGLRSQVAVRTSYYGQKESTSEPQYDVKKVDRKITELQNWLYQVDAAIKMTNAVTEVVGNLKVDVDELLAPLEE
jgi:hypothetical protein